MVLLSKRVLDLQDALGLLNDERTASKASKGSPAATPRAGNLETPADLEMELTSRRSKKKAKKCGDRLRR